MVYEVRKKNLVGCCRVTGGEVAGTQGIKKRQKTEA
jgi:hypothetical protein